MSLYYFFSVYSTLAIYDINSGIVQVRSRLLKAAGEIGEKYESGNGGQDSSIDDPTGAAYKEKQAAEKALRKQQRERQAAVEAASAPKSSGGEGGLEEGDDEDEDYDLRQLREQRLKQIKDSHQQRLDNLGKGHGQYREISQDEFLNEVTSSLRVVCHFYHGDFPRCKIIDHHIQRLVARHVETKFIKINAEKAPFFAEKVCVPLQCPRNPFPFQLNFLKIIIILDNFVCILSLACYPNNPYTDRKSVV